MAPSTATSRLEKEKRINSILLFAQELQVALSTLPEPIVSESLVDSLEKQIQEFPNNAASAVASKCGELDSTGTGLWNTCTRVKRREGSCKRLSMITMMARVFAFLMLDCAQRSGSGTINNILRIDKVALKTAKTCLEVKELELTLKVLEKAADYDDQLKKARAHIEPEYSEAYSKLRSEYFVLRIMLEWRRGRLEIAEQMFANASLSDQELGPSLSESLADLLFEMGKELLEKKFYELALKWLERAYSIINGQELDKLSADAVELRTSIIQYTVKALLSLQQIDAAAKAGSLVMLLESEVGDKLIVLLMKLELLSASNDVFDSAAYGSVIQKIIRTVNLTDTNFKLILHHIRRLNDKSPTLSCKILDEFLCTRLFEAEKLEYVEKALINRLWIATNHRDDPRLPSSLQETLEMIALNIKKPIGASAAYAAQVLLWKRIESNIALGQYEVAELWCRLAMHRIFEDAGNLNKAKIARKLLYCALSRHDIRGAQEIFGEMSDVAKNDPMTRFLMYKIAVRSGEAELAAECLEKVYESSSKEPNLLYACVLDAQQAGDRDLAVSAMQLVLERHQQNTCTSIHLPALLRCTIRLTKSQLEAQSKSKLDSESYMIVDRLCKLFEGSAGYAQKSHASATSEEKVFDTAELSWFSKNAYNLALKFSAEWEPLYILRLLQSCLKFIELYPKDIGQELADDLSLRCIFCHFLATILLIALARTEDNIETQLQYYLMIRQHVTSYDSSLQEKLGKLEDGPAEDLLNKLSILLAYDFEAAVQLKAWNDLGGIVLKAGACKKMKVYEIMADCILCCDGPAHVIIPNLKRIINAAWELENFDIVKLSRYMRCLLQQALPHDDFITEGLLDQIYSFAKEASESGQPYPMEELEWAATTVFNHAIDFYCAGEDEMCRKFAMKAINISSFCADGGALQNLLQKKFLGLSWDA